jgi:hypothetical protein
MDSKLILKFFILFLSAILSYVPQFSTQTKNTFRLDKVFPKPIEFSNIQSGGDLGIRLEKNFNRLEDQIYQPDTAFAMSPTWPGDYIGRLVLALTLLSQSTHHEAKDLEQIIKMFPSKMNSLGYFGEILPKGMADEQQLAGNGWVLRGLCEYYLWKKDPKVLDMIRKIINNLAYPTINMQANYPINPIKHEHGGSYIGHREEKVVNGWILSTDIGCNFIFLDGLTQAYEILREPKLKSLIDVMMGVFLKIDLAAIEAQTHATLTALRALCRYYELTKNPMLLKAIIERFDLYKKKAMSANYENYNWFGRPTHSEPCAIIDSYIVANYLWRFTQNPIYLEDAQHIYYNAIGATQRDNGGFGCNTCSGAQNPNLGMSIYEAYWCCTMRGGEGLSRVAQYTYYTKGNNIFLTDFLTNKASIHFGQEAITVKLSSNYPFGGDSQIEVLNSQLNSKVNFRIFAPSFTADYHIKINNQPVKFRKENGFCVINRKFKTGDKINISCQLKKQIKKPVGEYVIKGYKTIQYGPLILSVYKSGNKYKDVDIPANAKLIILSDHTFEHGNMKLIPVYNLMDKFSEKQILFKISNN